METQTSKCEKCKNDFQVDENDFSFYEKMGVLPPKLCPICRAQLRLSFRNERVFYKRMSIPIPRTCPDCRHTKRFKNRGPNKLWHRSCMKAGCANEFETNYAPDRPEIIYCEKCYQQEVY